MMIKKTLSNLTIRLARPEQNAALQPQ